VTLTASNTAGSSNVTNSITVTAAAVAPSSSFTFSPANPTSAQSISFTDKSTGQPTTWAWNFGDASTANTQNPSHTYVAAGIYTVTLKVDNSQGSSSSSQTMTVIAADAAPVASFSYSPVAPVSSQTVSFLDTSSGSPTGWSWNFGDAGTSTSENPTHTYAAAGNYTITLTASNAHGANSVSSTLAVTSAGAGSTAPTAAFNFAPAVPVTGQSASFTDTSTGGPTQWSWNFGDGGTSSTQNPSHTYATAKSYTVTLTASNSYGSNTVTEQTVVAAASNNTIFDGNIILGSPEPTSVQANIFTPDQSGMVYLSYGSASGVYSQTTTATAIQPATPLVIPMTGLSGNQQFYYRLFFKATGQTGYSSTSEFSFHTVRPAGSTFTFDIQGDSHPERVKTEFDPNLYTLTLQTAAADKPDFYMTIGDDFSVDTLDPTTIDNAEVAGRYTLQRPYFGLIANNAPIFLTNGNHEQAARYLLNGTPNSIAVWAQNARNTLYSEPATDAFYSGNTEQIPNIGLLRNYYAWTWGDALFVVIDPYWESPICVDEPFGGGAKRSNIWDVTHGDEQYQWLASTLHNSTAKYKFVFAHHVMGTGRGGIETATYYEWGGEDKNGTWDFQVNRPTWPEPLHQLMVDNKVTIFFQGHDHIWVHQQLDGVTYQTLSEPADPFYALLNSDAYLTGDKFPNTGYTRVTVAPADVKVEYVRTWLPADQSATQVSGSVAFSYTIAGSSSTAPTASFTSSPAAPTAGQPVSFTDTSTGNPTAWSWSFGDGNTSTAQNPTHSYATAGAYTVTLTATNSSGSGNISHSVTVAVAVSVPVSSFTYSPATPVSGQPVSFTDGSTNNPSGWLWNFGDGSTSASQNSNHTYSTAGTFTVALTVSNASGSNTSTQNVTVSQAGAAPSASFTVEPSAPVPAQPAAFTDTTTSSPTAWSWNFGDGSTSATQYPYHTYLTAGTYTVTLTATNAGGSSTATQVFTVSAPANSPTFDGSILLGSPEQTSIKANILSPDQSGTLTIQYGTASGAYTSTTSPVALKAGTPVTISMTSLTANTQYYYRVNLQLTSGITTSAGEYIFHTARPAGSTFTFTVQADSHLDENSNLVVYRTALDNMLADQGDFHIDLGDTFMCEKNSAPFTAIAQTAPSQAIVDARYNYERSNFGILAPSSPLFLVNGNHEGEAGWLNDGTGSNIAIWTVRARQTNFLNPVPDTFYSGDSAVTPYVGQRASWYAWQWGDALFIVLDPFWYTTQKPGSNGWNLTLGSNQYNWLQQTLAASSATYKFVFIHNLVGGLLGQMRGGVEAAPFYEWGGNNSDGTAGFSQMRPGWSMPIHQLLAKYGVTAVFHGHDHLYAHQTLDGIAYQEVPQPSAINENSGANLAASYNYVSGTILSSSGHMRVTVSPSNVSVQYVRAWTPSQVTTTKKNAEIDDSYIILAPK